MTVRVRGRVPREPGSDNKFTDGFNNIESRLLDLERQLAGAAPQFSIPNPTGGIATGGGGSAPGSGAGGGGGGIPPITDHGLLTGLLDDDHPQYAFRGEDEQPQFHVHGEWDVLGLENRFVQRGESIRPAAHTHGPEDVLMLDGKFVVRGESVRPAAHTHQLADVADYSLYESWLWTRIFGG